MFADDSDYAVIGGCTSRQPDFTVYRLGRFAVLPLMGQKPTKGNVFRGLIISTILMVAILYIATDLAPVTTLMAKGVNFPFPEGTAAISSLDGGAHLIPYSV